MPPRSLALLALAALVAAAAPVAAQRKVNERRAVAPDVALRVLNLVGSVRVIGWDRDTVAVTGTVSKAGAFYFGATGRGGKVGVELPAGEKASGPSHLEVRVPIRARVWVKTESAGIEVTGVEGELDLSSVSGAIRVSGPARQVYAESIDGEIELAGGARWVRAKTASAPIAMRDVSNDIAATTVSGSIAVTGGRFTRVRVESVMGDIRFEGELDRGGAFDFESHSGGIELRLPTAVDADFEVVNIHGETVHALAGGPTRVPGGQGRRLSFSVGRGGALVSVRSFKGEVRLLAR